ncbi:MAG: hypothetical protein LBV04_01365 [Deferribacteraceae bacterium]|jgi:hypothetical protein|nr:hypothetical protein [Deferribacteraceae bacterium]
MDERTKAKLEEYSKEFRQMENTNLDISDVQDINDGDVLIEEDFLIDDLDEIRDFVEKTRGIFK